MSDKNVELKEFAKKKNLIGSKHCILTISDNIFLERDTENRPIYQNGFNNIAATKNGKTLIIIDKKTKDKYQYLFANIETTNLWYKKLQSIEIPELTFLNDSAISIKKSGIIVELNKPFEDLFLYKKSELLGKDVVLLIDPTFTNTTEHTQHIKRYLTTGVGTLIGKPRKVRGLQKGGCPIDVVISLGENKINNEIYFTSTFKKIEKDDTKSLIIKRGLEKMLKKGAEDKLKSILKRCADDKHDFRVGCKEIDMITGIIMIRLNPCLSRLVETLNTKLSPEEIIYDFENYGNVSIIRDVFDTVFNSDKNYYEIMYLLIVCPLLVDVRKNECAKGVIKKINMEIDGLSNSATEER